ncbi:hypothetical protein [Paenibacillus popilliae]|nr:hypothetical protein [Paenibacillus popilliae]
MGRNPMSIKAGSRHPVRRIILFTMILMPWLSKRVIKYDPVR